MLERTFDEQKIRSILSHEDILWRISENPEDKDFPIPLTDDFHYLYEEGAVFIYHPIKEGWQIHANVTPEHRDSAYRMAQEAIDYGKNVIKAEKIIALIPQKHSNVYHFALKSGLQDKGLREGQHYLTLEVLK